MSDATKPADGPVGVTSTPQEARQHHQSNRGAWNEGAATIGTFTMLARRPAQGML